MNFLNIFENHVSGIFGAARAPFSFKRLARQAAHEMEDQTLVINGVDTAPALYTILVSANDDVMLGQFYPQLTDEVAEFVKAQAEKRRYVFVGEPLVRFMVDPSLKSGHFSVFAENVDAPTLGRLYEEERAYLSGTSFSMGAPAGAAPAPEPAPAHMPGRHTLDPIPQRRPSVEEPDPFAPAEAPVVPPTVSRDVLAGMGGAAATGGIRADHLGSTGSPTKPLAELADVVSGEKYRIDKPRTIIGRERQLVDIALRDPNVSRRHAELTYNGGAWTIEDLNSTNGTMVNNRRVTRSPLKDGDVVTFGLTTFEFRG